MENKIDKLTREEFIDLVKSSLNISEVLFKLGYSTKGNSWGYSKVKQRIKECDLKETDFKGKSAFIEYGRSTKINSEELFCKDSKHPRNILRNAIIRENLIPYKCAICGITEWKGKTLSLDHINGINNDNRLENLRFLCPNCHSQTDTYGFKNHKYLGNKYEITEELKNSVISKYLILKNQKKVSKELNIKLPIVKQIINSEHLGKVNQKYVIQYDENMNELNRFGTIAECCQYLMDNNLVKTKLIKTCRTTLLRNADKLWNNSYFKIYNTSDDI